MVNPWLGIGLVLGLLLAFFAMLRVFQRFASPHPEVVRKLMHVGMGLATLSFPWLFSDLWPVLLLAGLTMPALVAIRLVRGLKSGLGTVLGGVARKSLGEFYFVLSVAGLFWLTRDQPYRVIICSSCPTCSRPSVASRSILSSSRRLPFTRITAGWDWGACSSAGATWRRGNWATVGPFTRFFTRRTARDASVAARRA
jgi:hypothetical protein